MIRDCSETKTSIIIPVHNCLEYTKQCIQSIRENTENYELIIIDNGSTDDTWRWFKEQSVGRGDNNLLILKDGIVIRKEKNVGFVRAINQGMYNVEEGNNICWLNNDIIVTPDWLEHLLDHKTDMVGPCSNFVAGKQYTIPGGVYTDKQSLYDISDRLYLQNEGKSKRVNWLIGFCLLFSYDVYTAIGKLDERFEVGNSEDIDYCMRAKRYGFDLRIAKDVFIHHFGHTTFEEIGGDGYVYNFVFVNNKKLKEKWGENHDFSQ